MIVFKIIQSQFQLTTRYQPPGPTRGDLELHDACLPDEFAGWKKRNFTPPLQDVPEGQYWWSHSWSFISNNQHALVAFDQATFSGWHELTQCYQGIGWELVDREIAVPTDNNEQWPYVRARFRRSQSEYAGLVFSLFYSAADPVIPLDYEDIDTQGTDLLSRIANRRRHVGKQTTANLQRPALQCQVFSQSHVEFTDEMMDQLVDLHLKSRACFLDQWKTRHSESSIDTVTEAIQQ